MSGNISAEFKNNIINYLKYDAKIKENNKNNRELRSKRDIHETNILKFMESHNLKDKRLNLTDCSIQYSITENLQPINIDFIGDCLTKYFKNKDTSEKILNFIKKQRESNKKKSIHLKKRKLSKKACRK